MRSNFNFGSIRFHQQPRPSTRGEREEARSTVLRLLKGTMTARNKRVKVTLAKPSKKA
jgi:hypothetical protein